MGFSIKWDFPPKKFSIFENGILFQFLLKFFGKKQHFKIFIEISDSKSSLKSQIRNLRFLSDLAESTSTSVRSSWYLWIVPIPSRNCARAVWKFPLICCSVIIIRKLKIHMTKIWVDNFYWDVVSACDTAGTSCCSVFIETLGLDFFIKADNDFEI